MDTYQPLYDAVRSRLFNTDVGAAIESAIREANISHYASMASEMVRETLSEQQRPSVLFRPTLLIDGDKWCALYGSDLQEGVAGFGDSPDDAMRDFDSSWSKRLTILKRK